MTRISSLLVASTMAILPIAAFAQQTAPKEAAPTSMTSPVPHAAITAPVDGKAASSMPAAAKTGVKVSTPAAKTEMHSMNTVHRHHAKMIVPAKTAEPARS